MRFSDLCEKEVVNVKDCRCLGSVRDLDIDKECGRILALIVPGWENIWAVLQGQRIFYSMG